MVKETDQELTVDPEAENAAELTRIKDDINDVRTNLGETIDAIQERLTLPSITGNIREEVTDQLTSAVEATKDVIVDSVVNKVNGIMKNISEISKVGGGVVPIVLIGAGAVLILMNRRQKSQYRGLRVSKPSSSSMSGDVSTYQKAVGTAADTYDRVEEAVASTASKAAKAASSGKDMYMDYFDRNPVAVGVVAAAMGMAVGFALPLSESENELMGETADSIRGRLGQAANETVEKIKESADELIDGLDDSGRPSKPMSATS